MIVGSDFVGNYSRFTYDATKRYFMMLKEKEVPLLDDELNLMQEINLNLVKDALSTYVGDGSPDDGFKIVGTGANNNFTIKAGKFVLAGWQISIAANTTYSAQQYYTIASLSALTTPSGARTDEVYLDLWFDEVDASEDSLIVDPVIGARTSCRYQLRWAVKVAEGDTTPASALDGQNKYHWRLKIATLARTATPAINAEMVTDNRIGVIAANKIKFAPTGDIVATNVQSALAELDTKKLSLAGGTMTGYINLHDYPTAQNHAAAKGYVDARVHPPVHLCTTAALPTCTYSALSKKLTQSEPYAPLVVDTVTVTVGQRILVKDQVDQTQNGIYIVDAVGVSNTSPWELTRATDFNESKDLKSGSSIFTMNGSENLRKIWILVTPDPMTLDTTGLLFERQTVVAGVITEIPWSNVTGKPTEFNPTAHSHPPQRSRGEIRLSLSPNYDSTEIPLIGQEITITTYQALYDWAVSNNLIVSEYDWIYSGYTGLFSYGATSGKFRVPDFRGDFLRIFDNGRGLDSNRIFGKHQNASGVRNYVGNDPNIILGFMNSDSTVYIGTSPHGSAHTADGPACALIYHLQRPHNVTVYAYMTY